MPVSELGASERAAAQPLTRLSRRPILPAVATLWTASGAAAPLRAASHAAATLVAACRPALAPATSFPFAGRFSPETIGASTTQEMTYRNRSVT